MRLNITYAAVLAASVVLLAATLVQGEECENDTLPNGTKCPLTGQHLFPDEKHCSMYYECYDGCLFHILCGGNFLYDVDHQWCNYAEMVDCGDRDCDNRPCKPHEEPTDFKCPAPSGLFADPENCIKFYHCYESEPERKTCQINDGKQLLYDPAHDWCDWPDRVNCGDRPICDIHDENCSVQPPTPSSTHKPPTKCTSYGSCKSEGEHLDEGHCQGCFCVCTNGHYEEICCQQGLVFNSNLDACDWPYNVGC